MDKVHESQKKSLQLEYAANVPEKEYDSNKEHPTPEQVILREATKYLTREQRAIWEYHNYDQLTHEQIAEKLGVSHQNITKRIKVIEKKITKWVQSNMTAYNLIKENTKKEDE